MSALSNLNFHHLRYFWEVARHGSLRIAAEKLNVSQPTISAQIRALEDSLGHQLFDRSGRGLKLTPTGRTVVRFAGDIFGLGSQMLDAVDGEDGHQRLRLQVGVTDSFPKLFAWRLIRPAMTHHDGLFLSCSEGSSSELLGEMVTGRLDVILTDEPAPPSLPVKAFSHLLGNAPVLFCARQELADELSKGFPSSLNGAPVLLPAALSAWRYQLDHWFESNSVRPRVVAEFEDSALLKTAAADGLGVVPIAMAVAEEVAQRYDLHPIGTPQLCGFPSYLITVERSLRHPAVRSIAKQAKEIFDAAASPAKGGKKVKA